MSIYVGEYDRRNDMSRVGVKPSYYDPIGSYYNNDCVVNLGSRSRGIRGENIKKSYARVIGKGKKFKYKKKEFDDNFYRTIFK